MVFEVSSQGDFLDNPFILKAGSYEELGFRAPAAPPTFRMLFRQNGAFPQVLGSYDAGRLEGDLRRLLRRKKEALYFETPLSSKRRTFFLSFLIRLDEASESFIVFVRRLRQVERYVAPFLEASQKDLATGLLNKAICLQDIRSIDLSQKVFVIFCDIDNFKLINDVYGHIEGDKILRDFAEAFLDIRRNGVRVYRFGGDEFVVIARHLTREKIDRYLLDAKERVERHTPPDMRISFSAGIVEAAPYLKDPLFLIRCSDMAMYIAKKKKVPFYFLSPEEARKVVEEESAGHHVALDCPKTR